MIDDAARRALLAVFPPDVAVAIYTTRPTFYVAASRERAGLSVVALDAATATIPTTAAPYVVVEGLDDVPDPSALLRALRAAAPQARLFALVANAAHAGGLGAFISGSALASWHPLTRDELEPLLATAGWNALTVEPILEPGSTPSGPFPFELTANGVTFAVTDAPMLERLRTQGFLAVAAGA